MYAKFAPGDSSRVGYLYQNNIFVQELDGMGITQVHLWQYWILLGQY